MADTYKGESPSKRVARASYWNLALSHGGERVRRGKHLVLSSREGGDLHVLKSHGLLDHAVAVDRNRDAADEAAKKWPGVDVRHADVSDVAKQLGDSIGSVFLDFCAPITKETIATTVRVMDAMPNESILGVALLKGRERDVDDPIPIANGLVRSSRAYRRANLSSHRKWNRKMTGGDDLSPLDEMSFSLWQNAPMRVRQLLAAADRTYPGVDVGIRRHAALAAVAGSVSRRSMIFPLYVINYRSNTRESKGVPMTIGVYLKMSYESDLLVFPSTSNATITELQEQRLHTVDFDEEGLRHYVLKHPELALSLGVSSGTLAAWKAHATRGTYGI